MFLKTPPLSPLFGIRFCTNQNTNKTHRLISTQGNQGLTIPLKLQAVESLSKTISNGSSSGQNFTTPALTLVLGKQVDINCIYTVSLTSDWLIGMLFHVVIFCSMSCQKLVEKIQTDGFQKQSSDIAHPECTYSETSMAKVGHVLLVSTNVLSRV